MTLDFSCTKMPFRQSGFTLIELLVVMAILGTVLGLVGSFGVNNVDRAKSKTEAMQLTNWLVKQSYSAFNLGYGLDVQLNGKEVVSYLIEPSTSVDDEPEVLDRLSFDVVFFQPQSFQINRNGYFKQRKLSYQLGNKTLVIDLKALVNSGQDD